MATTRTWWNGTCLPSAWTCRATVRYTFMWEASGQPCSTTVSGNIVLINEHELEEDGDAYEPIVLNAGPHHGATVPLEDDLFAVTIQHPDFAQSPDDYRLPIGAEIWDLEGIHCTVREGLALTSMVTLATGTWPYSAAPAAC